MGVRTGFTQTIDRLAKVNAALKTLSENEVLFGVPSAKGLRKADEREKGEPINNAALMYIHEHGMPELNIPARPVVGPAVASIKEEAIKRLRQTAESILDGKSTDPTTQLNAVGLIGQNALRARITDGPFQALSERTLADRRRRGRKGDKPLIDTGQLRASLTYVVRPRGATDADA